MPEESNEQVVADTSVEADAAQPSNPEAPSNAASPDDQMRAILDSMTQTDGEDGGEPDTNDDDATPEAAATQSDESDEEPKEEGQAKDGGTTVEPERLDKARNALKRWKYPDDVISGLPEDRLLELGEAAIAQQAEQDRIGNQKRDLENLLKQIEAERARAQDANPEPEKADAAQATDADAPNDVPASISEVIEALRNDELYSDLAEPLTKAFGAIQSHYEQKLTAATKAFEDKVKLVDSLYTELDRVELNLARKELVSELPQLKDPDKYKAVAQRVYQLASLPGYTDELGNPDTVRLMRDAAQLEFGSELKQQLQEDLTQRYKKQSEGQPNGSTRNSMPSAGLDPDAKMRLALNKLTQGQKPEDVAHELASMSAG